MATPPVIDFERLLEPIAGDNPAGPELRSAEDQSQSLYYAVRDARKKAGHAERRQRMYEMLTDEEKELEPSAPEPADWESVEDFAIAALEKSKDLWIAAWLIEALARSAGFAGVRDGYRLVREICERFWDHLHPQPGEGEDLSTTFAQIAGLNGIDSEGTLVGPLMWIPITADTSVGQFSCADYLDAADLEQKDPDVRSQRIAQGAVSTEMFNRAVQETSADHFQNLLEDLQQANEEFRAFNDLVAEKLADVPGGREMSPPSSSIQETLDECLRLFKIVARDSLEVEQETEESDGDMVASAEGGEAQTAAGSRLQSREQAFRALLQVSDYFRRTEPHSPVSYAIEQAVRWGRMDLPDLLSELVADDSTREEIFRRTGIHGDSHEND